MRPSLKACVWLGHSDCYRNQGEVLWSESMHNAACRNGDRALKIKPSGLSMRSDRCASAAIERGGVTPFNVLPIQGANVENGKHGAATPLALAEWWAKYLTPPGGCLLDPFAGSGTMGVAAIRQGFDFIGIEKEAEYVGIAKARMGEAEAEAGPLFA